MCELAICLEQLVAPVTALTFVGDFLLLVGEGPHLRVYNVDTSEELASANVLGAANIHGIRVLQGSGVVDQHVSLVCVYGNKDVSIAQYNTKTYKIHLTVNRREFEDWIWDICQLTAPPCGQTVQPSSELRGQDGHTLAIAFSHNSVLHWDYLKDEILHHVHCEEKCILYTARFIGDTWDSLVLAAGTVFNQVILWKVTGHRNEHGRVKVMHRLCGHQGVIFSIVYHPGRQQICSVSDDRSIRIWQVASSRTEQLPSREHTVCDWEHAVFEPLHVLYGHSARVWDVRLLQDYVVSVGEDATTCVWNLQGQIVQKFKGHKGKSIWSVAVNEGETLVATGGGDTSIRLWPLGQRLQARSEVMTLAVELPVSAPEAVEGDFPRIVKLLEKSTVFTMTNAGCLWGYSSEAQCWSRLWQDDKYKSYSLLEVCGSSGQVAVANICGWICVLSAEGVPCVEEKLYEGKIFSIQWLSATVLLTTGPEGTLDMWDLKPSDTQASLSRVHHFMLPYTRQRWMSAALLLSEPGLLVCGDRGGTVHVYNVYSQQVDPTQSFARLHGKAGVTDLCYHDNQLYSCGRNGLYCQFSVETEQVHLLTSNKVFKGFDWLARLMFVDDYLVVLGFHNDQFIAYNVGSDQIIFCTPCGGGHRAWDFTLTPVTGHCTFVCIKTGGVRLCEGSISTGHTVLKPCLHGRGLTDVKHLFTVDQGSQSQHILATASEDTNLSLVAFYSNGESQPSQFKVIAILQGHISSIRALAVSRSTAVRHSESCKWAGTVRTNETTAGLPCSQSGDSCSCQSTQAVQSKLLFSGGGRAQLKAWRVHLDDTNHTDVSCKTELDSDSTQWKCWSEQLASHMLCMKGLKQRKPWKTHLYDASPETRYMGLVACCLTEYDSELSKHLHVLAAACSDGYVRLFGFNEKSNTFQLLALGNYHDHCVLCVRLLMTKTSANQRLAFVVSSATDGNVAFWDIGRTLRKFAGSDRRSCDKPVMASGSLCDKYKDSDCHQDSASRTQPGTTCCDATSHQTTSTDEEDAEMDATDRVVSMATEDLGSPVAVFKVHQSGVNALNLYHFQDTKYLLCTGGDDNSLNVLGLRVYADTTGDPQVSEDWRTGNDTAHAAQITGIDMLSVDTLVTSSIDQRLTVWRLCRDTHSQLRMVQTKFLPVADAACQTHWVQRSAKEEGVHHHLCVCGTGLQLITLSSVDREATGLQQSS